MTLDKAHEGYEYQDLLTVYFILKEILDETNSEFIIDRKEFEGDKLDDLLIRNKEGGFKKQIKYSGESTNHTFAKDNISAGSTYDLSLDSLYKSWLKHPKKESTEFRLCLAWNEPVDDLLNFLETVESRESFTGFPTKIFKVKGETLWPEGQQPHSSWRNFRREATLIDRSTFLKFCENFIIEVGLPKFSLNLNNPGNLEQLVLMQVQMIGVGVFPNNHLRPTEFVLHLIAIVKRARSKGIPIFVSGIFHELNIKTDFGKINQVFPVVQSENLSQKKKVEEFINKIHPFQKVLITGEPGSGKSWFIENIQRFLKGKNFKVIRHYCYINLDDSLQQERIKLNTFYGNLIHEIVNAYPELKRLKRKKFASNLTELNILLENIKEPTYMFIDGLDHINRVFHFRQFTDIPLDDVSIVENIQQLNTSPFVKIIVSTQNIPELDKFDDFKKFLIPEWNESEIICLLLKLGIPNGTLENREKLSHFLLKKSTGNPLYIKYLLDEIKRRPENIETLPAYSFNLKDYYQYLMSYLNKREDVAQVLSGVNFRLNITDLEEITGSGNFVADSIKILMPVLKPNFSHSGYIIYHESFRRFIIEELKANSVSVEHKVFQPVINWFAKNDFFAHQKTYRYSLGYLYDSGKHKEILKLLNHTFVTKSILHGQSWELIEANYKYFVKAACALKNFASVVLLNEINKILSTAKNDFLQLFPLYIESLGKTYGFQYVSEYLIFEGMPSFTIEEGLKACYICEENQVAAPWGLYMNFFQKTVKKDYFGYYVRGLLSLRNEKKLNSIAIKIKKKSLEAYGVIFRQEFQKHKPTDYVEALAEKYKNIKLILNQAENIEIANRDEVLQIADELLKFKYCFTNEVVVLEKFLSSIRLLKDEKLLVELIDKFKGQNWFYNWIIYCLKLALLKLDDKLSYFKIKEAFNYLQYTTEPFRGKPRTCDLYSAHHIIYESLQDGLRLINSPEEWKSIIDILVKVSDGTTTSLQRSLGGPLSTDTLFKLLSEFACDNNRMYIVTTFQELSKEKEEYHLHSDIAEYNFRLASLHGSANDKNKALEFFKKGVEYSLAYTMRKDLTLIDAINGIEFYASIQPKKALEDLKTVRVLVDSAVAHTDGKETNHFPNMWFEQFLKIDFHNAALYLLHELRDSRFDWRAEKSLVDLLCQANGTVDPIVEFYLVMTLPIKESEKFINYCFNLHKILEPTQPDFAKKLMTKIITISQPRHNKSLSEELIGKVNEKIYSGGYDEAFLVPAPKKYNPPPKKETFKDQMLIRKEFSLMSEIELLNYFEETGVLEKDLHSLHFFFRQLKEVTESSKQLIQTIVIKNNRSYSDKIDVDPVFSSQDDIECYYWVCRFVYDVGGWFEKFVNEKAFLKAHSINAEKAFSYLWELLPSQLDLGFNFEFSSNLIKSLTKVEYHQEVITSMWNNLLTVSGYRLPAKEELAWNEILNDKLEMKIEEIFIAIMICRYRAATTERFQWTTSALDYFFEHKQDMLLKPLKWFFANQSIFLDSVLAIIVQLLKKQSQKESLYHLNFRQELQNIFPKHYFLVDSLVASLLNVSMPVIEISDSLIYPSLKDDSYDFFWDLNRRFRPMKNASIFLEPVFDKYVGSFRSIHNDYLELYYNRSHDISVSHVFTSDYLLKILNTELYKELISWKKVEHERLFRYASMIDIDSMLCFINSFDLRPNDLKKPYEFQGAYMKANVEKAEWVRLGHYEFCLKLKVVRRGISFKSFGGIVFSEDESQLFPYSDYSIFPMLIWEKLGVKIPIEKEIVLALLQEDPLEFYKVLWLNPTLVETLGLKVKSGNSGLIATNDANENVLKMRTWSSDYIGDDYRSSISDEIPQLQGTDIIIRADYFDRLSAYFDAPPTYRIVKMEFPQNQNDNEVE